MSTHRHSLSGYRKTWGPLFLIGWGLLALQLWFGSSTVAFASSAHSLAATPTPVPTAPALQDEGFALARVSVVRLLVSYVDPTDSTKTVALCTGLGVVIKSLPAGNQPNDLVLTDASLVNKTQASCANGQPAGLLSRVQISFNNTYGSQSKPISIDTTNLPLPLGPVIACASDANNCTDGLAVIAFQGDLLPFVDFSASSAAGTASSTPSINTASSTPSTNSDRPLGLTDQVGTVRPPAPSSTDVAKYTSAIAGFLTPQFVDSSSSNAKSPETGTPFIDSEGLLTRVQSPGASTSASQSLITALIANTPALASFSSDADNTVDTNWKNGIHAFYQGQNSSAQNDFNNAFALNSHFQGAKDFAGFAQNALRSSNSTSSSSSNGPGFVIPGTNIFLGLWASSIVALVFFAVLVVVTSLVLGPRVRRRRAFKADLGVADRRAASLAQELERLEASQRDFMEHNRAYEQPTFPIQQQALQDKTLVRQPPREIRCPNCAEVVAPDANYCPNCRQLLSPTESGLHRRVRLPASPAQSSAPANPYANSQPRSVPLCCIHRDVHLTCQ